MFLPDLGKYTVPVLGAYAVALLLILILTVQSLIRAARITRDLAETEERRKHHD